MQLLEREVLVVVDKVTVWTAVGDSIYHNRYCSIALTSPCPAVIHDRL